MTYESWLRRVRQLLGEEGLSPADFPDWDWLAICEEGNTPEEIAGDAVREWYSMSEADPDFFDYMAHSDADPGL